MDRPPRIALELAYLGGAFAGWQRQPDTRTVQGELERALEELYRRPVRAVGAGRTDAGVHAAAQVAHFEPPLAIPRTGIVRALNGALPPEVRVLRAWSVPPSFDARASATGKRYRYRDRRARPRAQARHRGRGRRVPARHGAADRRRPHRGRPGRPTARVVRSPRPRAGDAPAGADRPAARPHPGAGGLSPTPPPS